MPTVTLDGMNIGVLGTGVVGRSIATRLVELGHAVALGTRDVTNPAAQQWVASVGTARGARVSTFAEAAAHGALVVNATSGAASIAALKLAGDRNLHGKVLIDVANPLDFSAGLPPLLSVVNTDSLGEQIQRSFPDVKVVKTLNTVNVEVMIHPARLPEEHTMFVAGEDAEAKATAADLLRSFGWRSILDLGGIEAARGMEMYLMLWLSLRAAQGTAAFNLRLVRA
ncbi:MAG TPA: NAD(P)-binding domain-containing protein [Micromonosporaceae bacterium]